MEVDKLILGQSSIEDRVLRFKQFLAGQVEGPIWAEFTFNQQQRSEESERHDAFAYGLGAPEIVLPDHPVDEIFNMVSEESGLFVMRQTVILDRVPNTFCQPGSLYVSYYGDSWLNQN